MKKVTLYADPEQVDYIDALTHYLRNQGCKATMSSMLRMGWQLIETLDLEQVEKAWRLCERASLQKSGGVDRTT